MFVYNLALAAALLATAANAETGSTGPLDSDEFNPAFSASRSLKRRTLSRVTPVDAGSSGVLVEEDIYGTVDAASVSDSEVSALAAATPESPCGPGWKLLWNDEFKYNGKLDKNAWSYLEGDGTSFGIPGWGNGELQVRYDFTLDRWTEMPLTHSSILAFSYNLYVL